LEEAKDFLKVDYGDEDIFIQDLINASEQYLKNATGKTFDSTN
ncbi:MAG TPA: phage gp6-like head-tail connector protein, partial [Clostridiaceae bacterium]|nr:phage gp6-like head-tail connector protein [Clostridiaceae bacterium]